MSMRNEKTLLELHKLCDFIGNTDSMNMLEIGCYAGESTEVWCKRFNNVIAIDPWLSGKGYDSNDIASKNMSNGIEKQFDNRMKSYKNIIKIKNFSYNVCNSIEDNSLDFVYIDGEHTYDGVMRDIELFLPKIKTGGYIGGHDYKPKWVGVVNAVNEKLGIPDNIFEDKSWIFKL